jgi:hypothetical protein
LKRDGTRAETRFRLSPKRMSPFKSAGASVQSTTGSRGVRIGGSNAGYTMFRGSVKSTGYPLHSSVSLSLPLPCVAVCHHILTGLYLPTSELTLSCLSPMHNTIPSTIQADHSVVVSCNINQQKIGHVLKNHFMIQHNSRSG